MITDPLFATEFNYRASSPLLFWLSMSHFSVSSSVRVDHLATWMRSFFARFSGNCHWARQFSKFLCHSLIWSIRSTKNNNSSSTRNWIQLQSLRPIIIWTAHVPVFRLSSASFCPLNNLNAVIFLPFYRELPPRKSLFELSAGDLKVLWHSYFMLMGCSWYYNNNTLNAFICCFWLPNKC